MGIGIHIPAVDDSTSTEKESKHVSHLGSFFLLIAMSINLKTLNLYAALVLVLGKSYYTFIVAENPDAVTGRALKSLPDGSKITNVIFLSKANDDDLGNVHLVPSKSDLKFEHLNSNVVELVTLLASMICKLNQTCCSLERVMSDLDYGKFVYDIEVDGVLKRCSVRAKSLEDAFVLAEQFVHDCHGKDIEIKNLQPTK
ncbi:MAG: hypothetical protein COA78_34335 [Blastopirellula sp.]|nr:MAG: hypothetical protein COA78_34335 [Blastopirellula sp.]